MTVYPPRAPGQARQVTIELNQRAFSFWSTRLRRWVGEAGDFTIEVGPHSRDLPLAQTVTIEAPPVVVPLDRNSPLRKWMNDPVGRRLLERELADPAHAPIPKEQIERMGNFPLSHLVNFGVNLDHDAADRVASAWSPRP